MINILHRRLELLYTTTRKPKLGCQIWIHRTPSTSSAVERIAEAHTSKRRLLFNTTLRSLASSECLDAVIGDGTNVVLLIPEGSVNIDYALSTSARMLGMDAQGMVENTPGWQQWRSMIYANEILFKTEGLKWFLDILSPVFYSISSVPVDTASSSYYCTSACFPRRPQLTRPLIVPRPVFSSCRWPSKFVRNAQRSRDDFLCMHLMRNACYARASCCFTYCFRSAAQPLAPTAAEPLWPSSMFVGVDLRASQCRVVAKDTIRCEATQSIYKLSHLGRLAWTFGGQSVCLSIVTTQVT